MKELSVATQPAEANRHNLPVLSAPKEANRQNLPVSQPKDDFGDIEDLFMVCWMNVAKALYRTENDPERKKLFRDILNKQQQQQRREG